MSFLVNPADRTCVSRFILHSYMYRLGIPFLHLLVDNRLLLLYCHVCVGPPSPPEPPSVSVKDESTLAVSWSAPWSFPIAHYTLRMINASSSELIGLWVTNSTELLVNKTQSFNCDLLLFTVEAFTEVGSTGPSEVTVAGFPTSEFIVIELLPLKEKVAN